MRHINGLYTQRFNRAHRRDGPLFRGRSRALCLDAAAHLGAVVRYVHRNPVEAYFARDPGAYSWSSHPAYLHRRRRPRSWRGAGAGATKGGRWRSGW